MGSDLFKQFEPIKPEYKNENLEILTAYEEHYMKLIRNYKAEIADIEGMLAQVRKERTDFYESKLPKIEKSIQEDKVLSCEAKEKWIMDLKDNVEKSFTTSESLIKHYVTENLKEFRQKMESAIKKV